MTPLKQTEEEYFNIMYRGLESQGFQRCVDKDYYCVYDDPNGRHCAIGWLFKAKNVIVPTEWVTLGITSMIMEEKLPEIAEVLNKVSVPFLRKMQNIHDYNNDGELMQQTLLAYAKERGFTITE